MTEVKEKNIKRPNIIKSSLKKAWNFLCPEAELEKQTRELIEKERNALKKIEVLKKMEKYPSYFQSFEQSRQTKYIQDYAHIRYSGYVDTDFYKRNDKQKNEISNIINKFPLEIIALSFIAEKNKENQFSSHIRDINDLRTKIVDTPQVEKLTEQLKKQLHVMGIEEATKQVKEEALPDPNLGRLSNNENYSVKTAKGRE